MKKVVLILILALPVFSLPFTASAISYNDVTVSEAKTMINSNPFLVILDVRSQSEYDSGHIKNAILIPVTELEARLDELNTTHEILVYCRSGVRSATASQILADNGFLHVYNMLGGITAWINEGYQVYIKYTSIQEAINNANERDTIYVSSGTYYENVFVNKAVSLVGENPDTAIIDGYGNGHVLDIVKPNSEISSFTIRNAGSTPEFSAIQLWRQTNITVCNNIITKSWNGIMLLSSNSSNLANNTIIDNYAHGVSFEENSHNNEVIGNIITQNPVGVSISGNSENNTFYHNNFINNSQHVFVGIGASTNWDNGCEGNYWSDYDGTDLDGDGIGDTLLPHLGVDYYPLMSPYIEGDVNHDGVVDIYDVVRVCAAYGSEPSDPQWNCHADIAEPYGIINIYDVVVVCSNYERRWLDA